ncbi:hypothetical protein LshimejAT787_1801230 [Lyophyllum shimeji]|uniref:DUF6534 domain-containing protein n=1 Tax=Lyophyllum shimeji TaxID=47721 RepID=A0A9P3UW54_LYOSH|nr:hypothetical protein LshimejAT787_1801230 [Lyophyllum shimeji]
MATSSSSAMTGEDRRRAIFLLGPWLVGSCLDIFLQGALCCQFITYFSCYKSDRIRLRLTVAGLALITMLKTVHSFAIVWIMLILHFKDLSGAIKLNYTAWWQTGDSMMVATIDLYVQIFFLHRLWRVSKKNVWFIFPIAIVLCFAYVAICVATYYISIGKNGTISKWFAAHLSSVFAGDLMLTVFIAYHLLRSQRETVLPATVGLLRALVRLTFQSAAPAAFCAMLNLIFSQLYPGNDALISVAFNQMLPKLYAFSMMWTLNARHSIRAHYGDTGDTSSQRLGDVDLELRNVSHRIQVRTHSEITQHIDFNDPTRTKAHADELKPGIE